MNDQRFWGLPMCLETPKGPDLKEDRENLTLLRSLIAANLTLAHSDGRGKGEGEVKPESKSPERTTARRDRSDNPRARRSPRPQRTRAGTRMRLAGKLAFDDADAKRVTTLTAQSKDIERCAPAIADKARSG